MQPKKKKKKCNLVSENQEGSLKFELTTSIE